MKDLNDLTYFELQLIIIVLMGNVTFDQNVTQVIEKLKQNASHRIKEVTSNA